MNCSPSSNASSGVCRQRHLSASSQLRPRHQRKVFQRGALGFARPGEPFDNIATLLSHVQRRKHPNGKHHEHPVNTGPHPRILPPRGNGHPGGYTIGARRPPLYWRTNLKGTLNELDPPVAGNFQPRTCCSMHFATVGSLPLALTLFTLPSPATEIAASTLTEPVAWELSQQRRLTDG
jgi:hypothetical protein